MDDEVCSVVFEADVSLQDQYNTEFISTITKSNWLVDTYTCRWEYCHSQGYSLVKGLARQTKSGFYLGQEF